MGLFPRNEKYFDQLNQFVASIHKGAALFVRLFDDFGRKFVCSNSDHIQLVMFEDRYVARNPYLAAPSPRVSIAADGPQADVFRASVVDTTTESFVFELTGASDKIDSFIALMRELGLVEVGRSGIVGMMRGAEGA